MGAEASDDDGEPSDPRPPARQWIRVVDRIMWGVDVPESTAERSRRWKSARRDMLSAAKWLGRFFS